MALKITLTDGAEHVFPFGPDSQLTVDTPDGVHGVKHGSWGEVAHVEVVDNSELPSDEPVPVEQDVVEPVTFGDTAAGTDTFADFGSDADPDADAAPVVFDQES